MSNYRAIKPVLLISLWMQCSCGAIFLDKDLDKLDYIVNLQGKLNLEKYADIGSNIEAYAYSIDTREIDSLLSRNELSIEIIQQLKIENLTLIANDTLPSHSRYRYVSISYL